MHESTEEITRLLNLAARGDAEASRAVFPAIYQELRRLAAAQRAKNPMGETLRTTALVHEAYLRIGSASRESGPGTPRWEGLRHFYFAAARAMHDILVEEARRRASLKRGGGQKRVEIEADEIPWNFDTSPESVMAIEDALVKLGTEDPQGHRLVLLRFYTGLSHQEIADLMDLSLRTVERRWRFLRAWLARAMGETAA